MTGPKRFATVLLAAGVVVLLTAILLGEHMGDRVMTEAAERSRAASDPLIRMSRRSMDVSL